MFRLSFQILGILGITAACVLYIIFSRIILGLTSVSVGRECKTYMSTLSDSLNIFANYLPGAIKTESVSKKANNERKIPKASIQTIGSSRERDIHVCAYKEPCTIGDDSKMCDKYRILGECLLISGLPGKVLRTLVDSEASQGIQHAFSKMNRVNMISKDANLVFYLSVYPLFHIQTSDYDVFFIVSIQCHWQRHSKSAMSS